MVADFAPAIDDFLVGEHRAKRLAPPDRRLGHVSKALGVAIGAALGFQLAGGRGSRRALVSRYRNGLAETLAFPLLRVAQFRRIRERVDGFSLVGLRIEP